MIANIYRHFSQAILLVWLFGSLQLMFAQSARPQVNKTPTQFEFKDGNGKIILNLPYEVFGNDSTQLRLYGNESTYHQYQDLMSLVQANTAYKLVDTSSKPLDNLHAFFLSIKQEHAYEIMPVRLIRSANNVITHIQLGEEQFPIRKIASTYLLANVGDNRARFRQYVLPALKITEAFNLDSLFNAAINQAQIFKITSAMGLGEVYQDSIAGMPIGGSMLLTRNFLLSLLIAECMANGDTYIIDGSLEKMAAYPDHFQALVDLNTFNHLTKPAPEPTNWWEPLLLIMTLLLFLILLRFMWIRRKISTSFPSPYLPSILQKLEIQDANMLQDLISSLHGYVNEQEGYEFPYRKNEMQIGSQVFNIKAKEGKKASVSTQLYNSLIEERTRRFLFTERYSKEALQSSTFFSRKFKLFLQYIFGKTPATGTSWTADEAFLLCLAACKASDIKVGTFKPSTSHKIYKQLRNYLLKLRINHQYSPEEAGISNIFSAYGRDVIKLIRNTLKRISEHNEANRLSFDEFVHALKEYVGNSPQAIEQIDGLVSRVETLEDTEALAVLQQGKQDVIKNYQDLEKNFDKFKISATPRLDKLDAIYKILGLKEGDDLLAPIQQLIAVDEFKKKWEPFIEDYKSSTLPANLQNKPLSTVFASIKNYEQKAFMDEEAMGELQTKVNQFQQHIQQLETERNDLLERNQLVHTFKVELENKLETTTKTLSALQADYSSVNEERDQLQQRLDVLQTQFDERTRLEGEIEQLDDPAHRLDKIVQLHTQGTKNDSWHHYLQMKNDANFYQHLVSELDGHNDPNLQQRAQDYLADYAHRAPAYEQSIQIYTHVNKLLDLNKGSDLDFLRKTDLISQILQGYAAAEMFPIDAIRQQYMGSEILKTFVQLIQEDEERGVVEHHWQNLGRDLPAYKHWDLWVPVKEAYYEKLQSENSSMVIDRLVPLVESFDTHQQNVRGDVMELKGNDKAAYMKYFLEMGLIMYDYVMYEKGKESRHGYHKPGLEYFLNGGKLDEMENTFTRFSENPTVDKNFHFHIFNLARSFGISELDALARGAYFPKEKLQA